LTRALGDYFNVVEGIDVSPTMIEKAQALNKDRGHLSFSLNKNTRTNYEDDTFSFVYTTIVLQHIPYQQQIEYIGEFTRILKSGGVLVFQIPTNVISTGRASIIQRIKSRLRVRERLSKIGIGKFYPMQMNSIAEDEIKRILEDGSCEIVSHLFTNHTNADFGGKLRFIKREESTGYESSMFIVRKK
jgi:ubiquinone/menaquinone biosynthesis C-methylase UbiE